MLQLDESTTLWNKEEMYFELSYRVDTPAQSTINWRSIYMRPMLFLDDRWVYIDTKKPEFFLISLPFFPT